MPRYTSYPPVVIGRDQPPVARAVDPNGPPVSIGTPGQPYPAQPQKSWVQKWLENHPEIR